MIGQGAPMGWLGRVKEGFSTGMRRFALREDEDDEDGEQGIEMSSFGGKSSLLTAYGRRESGWKARLMPNRDQRTILILMAITAVLVTAASETRLGRFFVYPFAILSTVFHEFGHATMAWLTGGSMGSIEIKMDESGATRFHGGFVCAILPAGYIGSTLLGALLLFMAFGRRTARATSVGVMVILAITFIWASGWFTYVASAALLTLLAGAIWFQEGAYTRHFLIVLGVCASLQSILSILNSTVFNTIEGSDAYVFARRCSFLIPAFVYGLLWFILSLAIQIAAIVGAIVFFKRR